MGFIAGGVVINSVKGEMPKEGHARVGPFVAGAFGYALVLLMFGWRRGLADPRVVVADGDRGEVGADRRVGPLAHGGADRLAAVDRRRKGDADARVALEVQVLRPLMVVCPPL